MGGLSLRMDHSAPFDFRAFHASHRIGMIVACSKNGVIGVDGDLPWRLPADLRHFMRSTKGCSVIMGRKTYESLGKPLPDRLNIVLSRSAGEIASSESSQELRWASSIEEGVQIAADAQCDMAMDAPIWIAGGGHLYKQAMDTPNLVDLIVCTRVDAHVDGDTVFPDIDQTVWHLAHSEAFEPDDRHRFGMVIEWWVRSEADEGP